MSLQSSTPQQEFKFVKFGGPQNLQSPTLRSFLKREEINMEKEPEVPMEENNLAKLKELGFTPKYKFFGESGLLFILFVSKRGDKFVAKVDKNQQCCDDGMDIHLQKRSCVSFRPKEHQVELMRCLKGDVCGSVYTNNGYFSVHERLADKLELLEEKYVLLENSNNQNFNYGESVFPYPMVLISDLLNRPKETEELLSDVCANMKKVILKQLKYKQKCLEEVVCKLDKQTKGLCEFLKLFEDETNKNSEILEKLYNQTCVNGCDKDLCSDVVKTIHCKKQLFHHCVCALESVYCHIDLLKKLTCKIEEYTAAPVSEFLSTRGKSYIRKPKH